METGREGREMETEPGERRRGEVGGERREIDERRREEWRGGERRGEEERGGEEGG